MTEVLVLGAGFGGVNAALEAAKQGADVEILDRRGHHEYTPGLIDRYRDRVPESKLVKDLNSIFDGTGVEVSREVVEDVDTAQRTVKTNAGERKYSKLVVALGSEPATFGNDISQAHHTYSLDAVRSTMKEIDEMEDAVVVGAGYVGVEVAAELAERGVEVTVCDGATRPMPRCPESASKKVLDYFNNKGIAFRAGKKVEALDSCEVRLDSGEKSEFDAVFWNAGIKTRGVVQDAFGVDREGIDVNSGMKARNFSNVYAVGDCAVGALKTAHNAMRQGAVAGANAAGREREWEEGPAPLITSLGNTGVAIFGERSIKSRPVRQMKDMVRRYYWTHLRKERLKAKLL